MLWNVPEVADQHEGERRPRTLAVAGTLQRRNRTVLTLVPLAAVRPNPQQPRKHFAEDRIAELATSIKQRGLLQPIVVRRRDGGFELLAGERRFRAAQLAGLDRLPALVRDGDDPLEIALIENLQREDLAPLEEAEALAALIEQHGYSHQEVADLLGRSRPYVSNMLSLTRLPDEVKSDLHRGAPVASRELLMGVARQDDPGAALTLWRQLKAGVPSVREFRARRSRSTSARPSVGELVVAAQRLNRALVVLLSEGSVPDGDVLQVRRLLHRTERLVRRGLTTLCAGA